MRHLIISLYIIFSVFAAFSQDQEYNFRQISPPGGLSFQSIQSITQDETGYIWLGTNDGVIRYDSKNFKRFIHHSADSTSLLNDEVTSLITDHHNRIWVGTIKGLNLYNPKEQSFIHFKYFIKKDSIIRGKIYDLSLDKNGNIWIVDDFGTGLLDTVSHTLKLVHKRSKTDTPSLLYFDKQNHGWLATKNGTVYQINPNSNEIKTVIKGDGFLVSAILADNNQVWVGYVNNGLRLYNENGKLIKQYSYEKDCRWDIKNSIVRAIKKDQSGTLWIGTYRGLFMEKNGQLVHFPPEKYPNIPHNSIYSIFEDQEKGIWFGTWAGGLFYLNSSDNHFNNFRHSNALNSLSNNIVSSFAQTPDGKLFVGTEVGSLNEFDPHKEVFKRIKLNLPFNNATNIKSLCTDRFGRLWVGTFNDGLLYRKSGENQFSQFPKGSEDGHSVSDRLINSLFPCDSGIWIGTGTKGINFYNFKTGKISFTKSLFKNLKLPNNSIRVIFQDSSSNLWIGTTKGLVKISQVDYTTKIFSHSIENNNSLNNNEIFCINELSDGKLWVGTKSGGISIIDPKNNDLISNFNPQGILQGKDVYGIVEDQVNGIWITTNQGLVYYNSAKGTIRNFLKVDGIQGNIFNPNAIFKDANNNLYFGGTNGFSQISPKRMKLNERPPRVMINKIFINNQKNYYPIQNNLQEIPVMELEADETAIKIEFTADNYLLSEKNQFKYRLLGFNDAWIHNDNEGSAIFTNLPSGEFIFQVKACNNDGIWNSTPNSMKISIAYPWWQTTWAYLVWFILFVAIIFIITKMILERVKLKRAVLIEKIERENEEFLHEMKLKVFTNISHEFRTPLTLIIGPLQHLLSKSNFNVQQKEMLEVIHRNSNRLLNLINQILDFRKLEKGVNKINASKFDLHKLTKEIILNFTLEAKEKKIQLDFHYLPDQLFIEADKEMLDKIIFNLLSNAFKYTPQKGKIIISIAIDDNNKTANYSNQIRLGSLTTKDYVKISIEDSGSGIENEQLILIFNRFERGKTIQKSGTGIGLSLCKEFTLLHQGEIIVQSTTGLGSCFSVCIPKKQPEQQINYSPYLEESRPVSLEKNESYSLPINNLSFQNSSILIVEDNEDLRNYILQIINSLYKTATATNGLEALELLKNNIFDLIISDVMMPDMDGFELCKITKSNMATSHIPVILLTALSSTDDQITGLLKGADAYLSKPFEDKLLITQINNLLFQRNQLRKSFQNHMISGNAFDAGKLENNFLKNLDGIIENQIQNENFSIEMLASEINLHRSQLHRKLKHLTNYSPTEYIKIYRVKKAADYLQNKEYNIDEIAYLTGFSSHSYFSRCFKNVYKVSPKIYRSDYFLKK